MKTRNIRGETGQVAFDDNGDRIYAEYDVVNIRDHQRKKIVGGFYYDLVSNWFLFFTFYLKKSFLFIFLFRLFFAFC